MELNENPESKDPNPFILRLVTRLFGGPHLPSRLLIFLLLVILTDYAHSLIRQPAIYWFDYSRNTHDPIGGYQFGPFAALGIYLIYMLALWVVLRIFTRKIAFPLWGGFLILHLSTFTGYPPACEGGLRVLLPWWLCNIDGDLINFLVGLIFGLALAWGIYEEKKPVEPGHQETQLSKLGLSRITATVMMAWLVILAVCVGIVAHIPSTGWRPMATQHIPTPRYETMIAYNTQSNKALLFGGTVEPSKGNWTEINDTWEWDGQDWKQLQPAKSPSARTRGVMAYDPKRNITVLFGGWNNLKKSLDDTWIWDGKNWKEIEDCQPCYAPPSRGCHNMFFDTVREEIVMYGGCNEYQTFYNDAWAWNGELWEAIDVAESPTASGAPIVYDPKNEWAVGFLAWQPTGTWIWDKNGWSKPVLEMEPPLRGNSMMANDPKTGNSLMFGGTKVGTDSTLFFTDTWFINGTTWKETKSDLTPPGRWGHVIFFDAKLKKFILFGGFDGRSTLNDQWEIGIDLE